MKHTSPKLHIPRLAALAALTPLFALTARAAESAGAPGVNMSVAYGITSFLALVLTALYCALVKKKDIWLLFLHICVVVVNLGYFYLARSHTLSEALLANRMSYLGAVFLPLCMLMTVADVCRVRFRAWLPWGLLVVSVLVFLLAASPGYLDWYYQEVSLVFVGGMAKLDKVYGPLHSLYYLYLLTYFLLMLGTILSSYAKKKTVSYRHAALLLVIVCLNIAIWLVEQFINSDFEFLSISYIISELLLLFLHGMVQEPHPLPSPPPAEVPAEDPPAPSSLSPAEVLTRWPAAAALTLREREVLLALLADRKRRDIAAELSVTEHTVKKHTANIFSKLAVSNRSELFEKVLRETGCSLSKNK